MNEKGEVIGVSVATFRGGQNLNFAIPSDYLKALLTKTGPVKPLVQSFTLTLVAEDYYRKEEQEGNTALTQGKFAEAASHYEKLLEFMPKEAVIWSNTAKAYVGAKQSQKALEAARRAAALDPKQYGELEKQLNGLISLEEGRVALENRDFPKAVAALTQALSVDPTNADAFYALALAYGHQKKYPEALKNIDEALKLKPNEAGFLDVKRTLTHNAGIK